MKITITTFTIFAIFASLMHANPVDILTAVDGLAVGIPDQAGSGNLTTDSPSLLVQPLAPNRKPNALTIIIDTSWSCEQEIPDFVSLGRHAVSSGLRPGDDLEVISAHGVRPKIRAVQTIKTGDPDEIKDITAILKGIRVGFLSNARVSKAIKMAFTRLNKTSAQRQYGQVTVIVFSDGRLTDADVEEVLDLAPQFRRKGWSLYLTGNKDTNPKLLVAANQGEFNWSLVSEATPAVWLHRQPATFAPEQKQKAPSQERQVKNIQEPIPESPLPPVESQKQATAEGPERKAEVAVEDVKSVQGAIPDRDESISRLPTEPKTPRSEGLSKPSMRSKTDSKDLLKNLLWWILLPAVVLLVLLGLTFSKAAKTASQWKTKVRSHFGKVPKPDPETLVAELNGQSYRLGRPDRFKAIHIGSGQENTIRVPDKSIQTRHVTIYRKAHDLLLRNTSRSPVSLNGREVAPGDRRRLVLPSVIALNDNVKLTLRLIRQAINPRRERSINNETG
jgi:hypothetical protein